MNLTDKHDTEDDINIDDDSVFDQPSTSTGSRNKTANVTKARGTSEPLRYNLRTRRNALSESANAASGEGPQRAPSMSETMEKVNNVARETASEDFDDALTNYHKRGSALTGFSLLLSSDSSARTISLESDIVPASTSTPEK